MWVARDKDNTLYLFNEKPIRMKDKLYEYWDGYGGHLLDESLFPELNWEDEPIEVELVNKKEKE